MVQKLGSDQQQLANSGGSVISQDNAVLINGDSDGSTALLFGPAAIREIQAGVANGDFAIPPSDSEGSITEDNDLPYFTATDSGNGRITATIADATLAAGQNVLRFTMTNAVAGDEFFIERFVSIPTSEARTFGNQPRFAVSAATSSANYRLYVETQYYQQDLTTTTGTGTSGVVTGAAIATSLAALSSAAVEYQQNPNGTGSAPEDAAFLFLKVGVKVTGAVASATLDLSEIRIDRSTIQYLLSDQVLPDLFGPASLYLYSGNLVLGNGGIVGSEPKMILGAASGDISLDATGQGDTITLTSANRTGSTVTIVTTRAHVFATGYEVVVAGITGTAGATMNGTYIVTVTNSTTFTYTSIGTAGAGTVTSATVKSGPGSGIIYLKPAATTQGRVQIDGPNSLWVSRATVASATQSLANNTDTKILLDTASTTPNGDSYDPKSWFSNANDQITVQQSGMYNIQGSVGFAANATSRRGMTLLVNGGVVASTQVAASPINETSLNISTNVYLFSGDVVTMTARQNSGGALSTTVVTGSYPVLSVARVGA